MKKLLHIVKKTTAGFMLLAFALGAFAPNQIAHAATSWDTTGAYVIDMDYLGTVYPHDMSLVQDASDNLTGNGGSPAGANTYTWVITSGSVTDDTIDFLADYTATSDAVTPQTTMHVIGAIAEDGTISGTWSDNYAGGERAGTFSTFSGAATQEPTPATVKVTILKYVDGSMATADSANNADFPMSATWNAENIGAGTGEYALSETGYNGDPTPYQAMTTDMTYGADYTTSEITTTEVVGSSCAVEGTEYALIGYAYGDTLAAAQAATPSLVAPNFVDMTSDKFVIVLNDDCSTAESGQIGGEVVSGVGTLEVTSIETVDSSATANNSFEDGWEYVFNITVPSDETDLSMKFADWVRTGGSETIPAGGNMRISSPQANNGGATILITAANTYSTPALTMITDLNPALDGIQVKVTVEVKIPVGTTNGSYTTMYGVRSE